MSDAAPSLTPPRPLPASPAAPRRTPGPRCRRSQPRWAALLLLLLSIVVLFPRLGSFGLWDPYEVRLLEGATEPIPAVQLGCRSACSGPRLPLLPIAWGSSAGDKRARRPGTDGGAGNPDPCRDAGARLGAASRAGGVLGGFALLTMPAFFLRPPGELDADADARADPRGDGLTIVCWPPRERRIVALGIGARCWRRRALGLAFVLRRAA